MKKNKSNPLVHFTLAALIAITILVMGHWSLMTLGELHGGLQVEFKHTLAMFSLLVIGRWFLLKPGKFENHLSEYSQVN